MKTDKTDIEIVRQRLDDIVELWCILNTCKRDKSANDTMGVISSVIQKDVLLKRWNELHPITTDPEKKIPFYDDPEYMEKRKAIISKLLC